MMFLDILQRRAKENRNNLGDGYTKSAFPGSLPRASWTRNLPLPPKQTWGARKPRLLGSEPHHFLWAKHPQQAAVACLWRARGLAPLAQAASPQHPLLEEGKGETLSSQLSAVGWGGMGSTHTVSQAPPGHRGRSGHQGFPRGVGHHSPDVAGCCWL